MQEIIAYDCEGNSLTSLVQWDRDIYVYLNEDDVNLEDSEIRVHFFNNTLNEALVVEATQGDNGIVAKIPNVLLSQPHIIIGYVYAEKENGEGKSIYCFKINVRKRPMPSNYIAEDTADWIDAREILDECSAYAKSVSQSVLEVETYYKQTKKYAEQAAEAETAITEKADSIKLSENVVASNASSAKENAISAGNSASAAKSSADAAEAAKNSIVNMSVSTQTLSPGESAVVEYSTSEEGNLSVKYGIPRGDSGYTPVKGTDYYTQEDVEAIVSDVVSQLDPTGEGSSHIHENKDLLDSITEEDKEKWNSSAKPARILTLTLLASDWVDCVQTIINQDIISSDSCVCLVTPENDCEIAYSDSFVRANDITTDGEITFTCQEVPEDDLVVRVLLLDAYS